MKGRLTDLAGIQPSLSGLMPIYTRAPNVETLGYSRMSLLDKGLYRFLGPSLGSNPREIGHSASHAGARTVADKNVRAPQYLTKGLS